MRQAPAMLGPAQPDADAAPPVEAASPAVTSTAASPAAAMDRVRFICVSFLIRPAR